MCQYYRNGVEVTSKRALVGATQPLGPVDANLPNTYPVLPRPEFVENVKP